MSTIFIPEGYTSTLSLYETQEAISLIKRNFEGFLSQSLNLKRVSAPLFVDPTTGLNDDLNGIERAVSFDIAETGTTAQVVHSLAKWKRFALHQYGFHLDEGLYTNMNAIRRDEEMTNLHSIYVDQWDWEKIISGAMRNQTYLKETVQKIVNAMCDTLDILKLHFPTLPVTLSREIDFITTQELENLYPLLTPKEREMTYVKTHPTTFIMEIGDLLASGQKHDGRAPDYDDWHLNGDLVFWNEVLGLAFEVSSMGIRVDATSLSLQLEQANCTHRKQFPFHQMLLNDELPLTIGGGIGQSRLCMLLLGKAHIGEVQSSIWDHATQTVCDQYKVTLL